MSGCVRPTASTTAAPPPPGMCTSTSTTSGCASPIARTGALDVGRLADDLERLAQLGAHARQEQPVVVDDEHPHGRGRRRSRGRPREPQADLGPARPATRPTSAVPPYRCRRPRIESAMPRRSSGTVSGSKPFPWSRTNAVTDSGSTSTYRETLAAPECFAAFVSASPHASTTACSPVVQRAVADDDRLDADAVGQLDALGQLVDGGAQQVGARLALRPVQPRAQLALLHAGQRRHPRRVLRALDERERLQHRVVQVRRDVLPLLRADALPALLGQLPREPHDPRPDDERQAGERHRGRDDDGPDRAARDVRGQERRRPAGHQHGADQQPDRRDRRRGRGVAVPRRGRRPQRRTPAATRARRGRRGPR